MARVEARSRTNWSRLRRLEQAKAEEAKRRLASAGVPDELIADVTDVLAPRDDWDASAAVPTREDTKR